MSLSRDELVYPELSYKIVGVLFEVYNTLGPGYAEKHYQKAVAQCLTENKLCFKEQLYIPLQYKNAFIGKYFIDFVIEEKIALEIKRGDHFLRPNIKQVYQYLQKTNLKLGILANFTSTKVSYKRIRNFT